MLELKGIGFKTVVDGSEKVILHDVNLKIEDKKFVVVTGPNGGGKSSLAKVISGIYEPTEGQMLFDGVDITHMSITERAKLGISLAFQQPVVFKGITVLDLMRIATGKNIPAAKACEYLSQVGLCAAEYINREVNSSLSGGELKRIEIASVIAHSTKFTVFDEPEAGIDLWSFQKLIDIFQKLHDKEEMESILIISHQSRILNIADEIVVISGGTVEKTGPRDEILPGLMGTSSAQDKCAGYADRVEKAKELAGGDRRNG